MADDGPLRARTHHTCASQVREYLAPPWNSRNSAPRSICGHNEGCGIWGPGAPRSAVRFILRLAVARCRRMADLAVALVEPLFAPRIRYTPFLPVLDFLFLRSVFPLRGIHVRILFISIVDTLLLSRYCPRLHGLIVNRYCRFYDFKRARDTEAFATLRVYCESFGKRVTSQISDESKVFYCRCDIKASCLKMSRERRLHLD